jgi:hypothetical protein
MRVDALFPPAENVEAIGYDKMRINHSSLDNPLVILANKALCAMALAAITLAHVHSAAGRGWFTWCLPIRLYGLGFIGCAPNAAPGVAAVDADAQKTTRPIGRFFVLSRWSHVSKEVICIVQLTTIFP